MGISCSSGQAHKDKDNASQQSEESPSYQISKAAGEGCAAQGGAGAREDARLDPQPSLKRPAFKGPRGIGSASVSDSMSLASPVATASPRELEPPASAGPLAPLPEDKRALLFGRLPSSGTRPRRNACIIYICAADSQDCCCEKGLLQRRTAVRLRAAARKRGWRLHVADLHWRSPLEQQRDHRFPQLCKAELARQSELGAVVPVVFLNWNLGTSLLPHTLDATDFRATLAATTDDDDKALLNKWYTMDCSATPPCYRLARGAPARWRREMARALNVLVRALPQEAADAYLTTVVEQEVHNTVLMSVEAARRCVWVCRNSNSAPAPAPTAPAAPGTPSAIDSDQQHELMRRLTNLHRDLKQHLTERNIIRMSMRGQSGGGGVGEAEYTAGLEAALDERLEALLDALVAENQLPLGYNGIPAKLFEEITEHLSFSQKSAQCTSNREITLNELKMYVVGESSVPLVLIGGAGCGKATLVARAVNMAPQWLPDLAIIVRFVGLTAHSASSHQLLKSIVDQCHVLHCGTVYKGRNDVASLTTALHRLLKALGQRGALLLAVVGTDALRGARWLPSKLPHNVKMLVTVTEEADEPSSSAVMAVLTSEEGPRVVRAPAPGIEEARGVLAACAASYPSVAAPPPHVTAALQRCPLPLYAKILAWQISQSAETFTDQTESEGSPEITICEDLEGQIVQVLVMTEAALGAARVRACLALLCAARRGLDDTEILDLLAHDPLFTSDETYLCWAPASLFWPQLAALLGAWLRWDARGAARFRDPALAAACHERYLQDDAAAAAVRSTLVDYYEGKWFEENDPKMGGRLISQENRFSEEFFNTRKLDELPYQHYCLSKDDPTSFAKKPYFTDHVWIYDKIAATDCGHLLEDISLIHLDPLPEHIEVLKDFLETHSFALDYDVRQFYGLLKVALEKRVREGNEMKSNICKEWLEVARNPPIPTLIAINEDFYKVMNDKDRGDITAAESFDIKNYDLVVRLEKCGKFVATVSTEREEIGVWDAAACRRVRTLRGVPYPINLVPIDQFKCVVLCRRELRVYDLDKGKFLVALKGVMNQKMPYYGLHDKSHLVALARNRMYVNLMNIETGDCVTTFKAGEDRFLNSLLVSGDGRVLVCGDETQKPFPLLVWSLTSRKLLYDLRIPHHDFLTSRAAITYEGSYVCVVARELEEPSPNFIVVYDLQSGTLFKKWKPGCDTCALAISSVDGCVVSGLADATILVWDLITGNCRLTLRGHTAAPTLLRFARAGSILLSADESCKDLSVRLWDLNAGKLIAVFSPPERISTCDVLCGGSLITLALENYRDLVTLKLEGPQPEAVIVGKEDDEVYYGDPDRDGKTFDMKDNEI